MRKVTSVAQASQLLAVACEDLPTPAGEEEEEDDDRPRYIRPANVSSLQNLPVPTASGNVVRFGSRRYTAPQSRSPFVLAIKIYCESTLPGQTTL